MKDSCLSPRGNEESKCTTQTLRRNNNVFSQRTKKKNYSS